MAIYFANRNHLNPPRREKDKPELESVTGVLLSFDTRPGNNSAGYWFIFRLQEGEEIISVYFKPEDIDDDDLSRYFMLRGMTVILRSHNNKPVLDTISVKSEGEIRADLLKGVAAGKIQMEDLPALLEFAKGKDGQNEKWALFKRQIEIEGLTSVKEDIARRIADEQDEIEREKAKLNQLQDIYQDVVKEKEERLRELNDAIMFLQGDDYLHGTYNNISLGVGSENLVRIDNGYKKLIEAFESFKTMKEVYVICENKIHRIHHAYLEEKGRAFLLGSSKEYLKNKPAEAKKLVDRIIHALYFNQSDQFNPD